MDKNTNFNLYDIGNSYMSKPDDFSTPPVYTVGAEFSAACILNLDDAIKLYTNYTEYCNYYMECCSFFASTLISFNKVDTLLWLKSLNNEIFNLQIDSIFINCMNKKDIECDQFKIAYKYFSDRFEYLYQNEKQQTTE